VKSTQASLLEYEVIRSRRKTADIIIERNGKVIVRAPEWANDEQIAKLVTSRYISICQGLAEWRELNAAHVVREYKNGEAFLYLGRAYRLSLVSEQDDSLVFRNGRFLMRCDLVDHATNASAKSAFRDFYISKGVVRLAARVNYYAPKVGVGPCTIDVKDLGHRWASCSTTGKLSFHWKIMMAPLNVIDYLVVHELCHFHHRDHTREFWNEVDKVMPDYLERQGWLRKNGAALVI
jgi:predicted metal-dependent hydrolase